MEILSLMEKDRKPKQRRRPQRRIEGEYIYRDRAAKRDSKRKAKEIDKELERQRGSRGIEHTWFQSVYEKL